MRSVVSNTGRRQQSCCTTVTTILCSRHRVPHTEVLESLSSAPACGVGSERVWVDLAASRPVCQPQLQQCATVSTQTPLCLSSSSSSSSSELNPSTAWGDSMEAQSAVFFSRFSMFTVIFHLEREESKLSIWLAQVKRAVCQSSIRQEIMNQMVNLTFPDIFNISGTALMYVRQSNSRYRNSVSVEEDFPGLKQSNVKIWTLINKWARLNMKQNMNNSYNKTLKIPCNSIKEITWCRYRALQEH